MSLRCTSVKIIALIVVRSSHLGLPVAAGFGRCGFRSFHCESVISLNMKTSSMLLFIDPNDHQNLSKWLVLGSVDYDATDKKKKEVYCGLNDDPKSRQKAITLEKNYLKKQKNELKLKIHYLEDRLNQIS